MPGAGEGGVCVFHGDRVSAWEEEVLKMVVVAAVQQCECTYCPRNGYLKHGYDGKFCYIFYHNKKDLKTNHLKTTYSPESRTSLEADHPSFYR